MKSRIIISIVLAALMLGTLATPALADRASGTLYQQHDELGTGKYALQSTHSNYLKVTVSISGAEADAIYKVSVYNAATGYWEQAGTIETNKNGRGRFSGYAVIEYPGNTAPRVFDSGDWSFTVHVYLGALQKFYSSPADTIHFK